MVNSEVLIGTTEYLTLYTRCCIHRCRYNRVRLHFYPTELFCCSFACAISKPNNRSYIPALVARNIFFFQHSDILTFNPRKHFSVFK